MSTNNLKTAMLLAFLGGLFVAVGYAINGGGGAVVGIVFAVVLNFGMYFFSDKIALRSARAVPAGENELPQVYAIVRSLAQRQNMPMPAIYVIDAPQPNAFATGRNPRHAAVAVTRGILDLMDYNELEGVLAHELAHVRNRDILIATVAATIGAALSFVARMAFWSGLGGRRREGNAIQGILGILAIFLAPLAAMVIQMALSRSREFEADRSGAEITGSPLNLARALEKLEMGTARIPMQVDPSVSQLFIADPLKAFGKKGGGLGGMTKMFATHPPIPERIERLTRMASGIR